MDLKTAIAGVFDRSAATYGRTGRDFFGPAGEQLVAALGLRPGEVVLDVGAGAGATTFPAAVAVGPGGRVLASDLAPGMVERIRAEARERRLPQVHAELGDAESPTVPEGGVDAVVAAFVLFFLAEPEAALHRYRAALRPGGRLGISWFGADDERWAPVLAALRSFLETPPPQRPGHPIFASVESLEAAVRAAGFADVTTREHRSELTFDDVDHWRAWGLSHGQRALWELVPAARLEEAKAAVADAMHGTYDVTGRATLRIVVRSTVATR